MCGYQKCVDTRVKEVLRGNQRQMIEERGGLAGWQVVRKQWMQLELHGFFRCESGFVNHLHSAESIKCSHAAATSIDLIICWCLHIVETHLDVHDESNHGLTFEICYAMFTFNAHFVLSF